MSGGLVSLASYGSQDIYLTGNPQVTLFKNTYKRYTPFARETIEIQFQGTPTFGQRTTAEISRNGDLVGETILKIQTPVLSSSNGQVQGWIDELGHFIINNVEFEIGGARMDKHYGIMFSAFQELWGCTEQKVNYDQMIGNTIDMTTEVPSIPSKYLYIPLKFWWNRTSGNYMPLIALQKHQLKINLELAQFSTLYKTSSATPSIPTPVTIPYCSLLVDYIFLDTEERRQFARMAHEYLVETVQFTGVENVTGTTYQQKLNFNHPCTELIVIPRLNSEEQANNWNNFADASGNDLITLLKLQLNGQDYQREQEGRYFNLVTPWKSHTNGPRTGIYVFPFANKPEEFQPSGSVNMSRIDSCVLNLTFANAVSTNLYTFSPNKNVFRILSGMGGLAYSN